MEPDTNLLYSMCKKVREDLVEIYTGMLFPKKGQQLMLLDTGKWRFFDEEFGGACAVASYMLSILARRHNVTLNLTGNRGHFFCKTQNLLIDPTHGQFDRKKPIYVGPTTTYWYHQEVFEDPKSILTRYPECQNPFSRYHRKPLQRWMNTL